MAYRDAKNNLFPDPGELVRHKGMGIVGRYVQDVACNGSRRHMKVIAVIDGVEKVLILPAGDFEEVKG